MQSSYQSWYEGGLLGVTLVALCLNPASEIVKKSTYIHCKCVKLKHRSNRVDKICGNNTADALDLSVPEKHFDQQTHFPRMWNNTTVSFESIP